MLFILHESWYIFFYLLYTYVPHRVFTSRCLFRTLGALELASLAIIFLPVSLSKGQLTARRRHLAWSIHSIVSGKSEPTALCGLRTTLPQPHSPTTAIRKFVYMAERARERAKPNRTDPITFTANYFCVPDCDCVCDCFCECASVCVCIVALWYGCGSFALFFIAAPAIFGLVLALFCVL